MDRRRAVGDPSRRDRDLHVQPRRRLRRDRRRHRERPDDGVRHRRRVRLDQGSDHVSDREKFTEVAEILGDKLVYLRQPNLGGAGGFTRGMYEVSGINEHANLILMDDDILCEPESILRMNAFANVTTEPTLVARRCCT